MTIEILPVGILIHCSARALREAGFSTERLNQTAALALAERALRSAQQFLPACPEVHLFSSKEELLIFVRSVFSCHGNFYPEFFAFS